MRRVHARIDVFLEADEKVTLKDLHIGLKAAAAQAAAALPHARIVVADLERVIVTIKD